MSKPYTLEGFTTRPGEKQLATMRELEAAEASRHPLRFLPLLGGLLLASLLLVLGTITTVAIVRRKMRGATNSPSQQLELLTGSGGLKGEAMDSLDSVDYSPDIIPKDGGTPLVIHTCVKQSILPHLHLEIHVHCQTMHQDTGKKLNCAFETLTSYPIRNNPILPFSHLIIFVMSIQTYSV